MGHKGRIGKCTTSRSLERWMKLPVHSHIAEQTQRNLETAPRWEAPPPEIDAPER